MDPAPPRLVPGEVLPGDGELPAVPPGRRGEIRITNTGDRPIQVGSHFHLAETNPALELDRAAARGMRPAIPAGTSVRFEPGLSRTIPMVAYGGARIVAGFRGEVAGPLDDPDDPEQ